MFGLGKTKPPRTARVSIEITVSQFQRLISLKNRKITDLENWLIENIKGDIYKKCSTAYYNSNVYLNAGNEDEKKNAQVFYEALSRMEKIDLYPESATYEVTALIPDYILSMIKEYESMPKFCKLNFFKETTQ